MKRVRVENLGEVRDSGELEICRGLVCLGVQGSWEFGVFEKGRIGVFEGLDGVGGSRGIWDV